MTYGKCPGQDMRNLRVSVHKCPNCSYEVEIFSDEMRVKCPKCKQYVYKEKVPSCIEWCTSAPQCLGKERWAELMENNKNSAKESKEEQWTKRKS